MVNSHDILVAPGGASSNSMRKHEKMNKLYVKRMQSVSCSLYFQRGVQLPKMGVNFTEKGGAATASFF